MKRINSLVEATVQVLQEENNNQQIEVDINEIINQAILKLKEVTDADIKFVSKTDNTVNLEVSGNAVSISVIKDVLNISSDNEVEVDNTASELKRNIYNTISDKYTNVQVKLIEVVQSYADMGTIRFKITVDEIPYPIKLSYSIFDDGEINCRLSCTGADRNERWSYSITSDPDDLLDKVKRIADYYNK